MALGYVVDPVRQPRRLMLGRVRERESDGQLRRRLVQHVQFVDELPVRHFQRFVPVRWPCFFFPPPHPHRRAVKPGWLCHPPPAPPEANSISPRSDSRRDAPCGSPPSARSNAGRAVPPAIDENAKYHRWLPLLGERRASVSRLPSGKAPPEIPAKSHIFQGSPRFAPPQSPSPARLSEFREWLETGNRSPFFRLASRLLRFTRVQP